MGNFGIFSKYFQLGGACIYIECSLDSNVIINKIYFKVFIFYLNLHSLIKYQRNIIQSSSLQGVVGSPCIRSIGLKNK